MMPHPEQSPATPRLSPDQRTHPACHYQRLESGVHLFTMYEENRAAVDVLLTLFEEVALSLPPEQVMRYIIDVHHVQNLPIPYALNKVREAMRRLPNRPLTRGVHLYNNRTLAALADSLFALLIRLSGDQARFFHVDDYEQALAWVLEGE